MVVIEPEAFCQTARSQNCEAVLDHDKEGYPLRVTMQGFEEPIPISRQLLARAAFEFASPKWLITASIEVVKRGYADVEFEERQ